MAINKYNDLSAIFSNHNNNNIDTIFENTSRNMLDVVKASSHDDEIRTSCFYYGLDDLGPSSNEYSSLLDLVHQCSGPVIGRQVVDPSPASSVMPGGESCSEVVNSGPTTPNSISISSSSSEALNEGLPKADDEDKNQDGDDNKSNKQLKAKKKKEKKKKEPRFAFMTQTDVDHLDDGYRWRKYGQKAVKNSPFPRSYYRCTTSACGVKKRVERSSEDPSIVVTTYEGQHSHPCPIMTRSGFGLGFGIEAGAGMGTRTFSSQPLDQCNTSPIVFGGYSAAFSSTSHIFPYFHNKYHQQQFPRNYTKFLNPNGSSSLRTLTFKDGGGCHGSSNSIICSLATTISSDGDGRVGVNNLQQSNPIIDNLQLRHIQPPCPTSNSHHQLRDDGLLQDIVPSQMRNKAIKEE